MPGFYSGRSGEGVELFPVSWRNFHRNSRMAASHLIHLFIQHVFIEQQPWTIHRCSGFIHSLGADIGQAPIVCPCTWPGARARGLGVSKIRPCLCFPKTESRK